MNSSLLPATLVSAALLTALSAAGQVKTPSVPIPDPPPQTLPSKPMASSDAAGTHITKDQAAALFHSVDDILAFVSKDSQLTATRPVKRKLLTRDEVKRELSRKMSEDEGTKRLERSELVLKKFGLLDRDFQLRPFLLSLLTEQVAAFYDPKTRTVNLIDWVQPDDQKAVLAHELTHALQDDLVHLETWSDPEPQTISKNTETDNRRLVLDEASTARESVTEGQGMVTYIDYELKDSGKTLASAPEVGARLRDMAADTTGSPILSRAPLLLQQSMLFPYSAGLAFEQALLVNGGVKTAFRDALQKPPTSSHEIIHPQDYLSHTPVSVLTMPNLHPVLDAEWEPYDLGVMGELDARIITELFGGRDLAGPVAIEWDGGIYYAAQRRADSPAQKTQKSSIGVLYLSQWKNRDSARSFLNVYAGALARKYDTLTPVQFQDGDADHLLFHTEEGDVWLSLEDNSVFISEGFDRATARRLDTLFRDAQGHGPLQTAGATVPGNELTLTLSRLLPGIGVPRAAIAAASRSAH